jgi:putative oxidoreductase
MVSAMGSTSNETARDLGLLLLRTLMGSTMALSHGLPKLLSFGEKAATFSDPLGVGSTASLTLAIFGELVCSLAVVLGLFTRLSAIPVVFTMLVAAIVVHAGDPWAKKEFALIFAVPFFVLVFTGPGRFSVDAWLARRRARKG